jgi:hypothetical protein
VIFFNHSTTNFFSQATTITQLAPYYSACPYYYSACPYYYSACPYYYSACPYYYSACTELSIPPTTVGGWFNCHLPHEHPLLNTTNGSWWIIHSSLWFRPENGAGYFCSQTH